jgi:mRNA interferase MazF
VWLADLEPTRGREQSGERPVLIVSTDRFNQGRSRGLRDVSFAMCEQVRSLAVDRLGSQPFGRVPAAVLDSVENRLRLLLAL